MYDVGQNYAGTWRAAELLEHIFYLCWRSDGLEIRLFNREMESLSTEEYNGVDWEAIDIFALM